MKELTPPAEKGYYTYMLLCGDGSLYTGWTNDLRKRLAAHQSGNGAKYTRSHEPVRLVWYQNFGSRSQAMRREAEIKKLCRADKDKMIAAGETTSSD